jgi:flagellar motility protein MotE (MotC chaperone)
VKFRPRLIPSVILAATILLGLKVSDIFSVGGHALAEVTSSSAKTQATGAPMDLTSQANAVKMQSISPEAGKPEETPAKSDTPPQAAAKPKQAEGAKPTQTAEAPPADKTAEKPGADKANAEKAGGDKAGSEKTASRTPAKDPLLLSPAEIEVLQQLSARRTQIDQRAGELDQQQVVLQATEKRIDEKIAKLDALQKSIQASVDKQNAADDARTQSLVKIYETMKPTDAAQILSQMDMPILLQMLSHMKEAKTAPILAAMDPTKAEAITTAMAKRSNPPSPTDAPAKP